jgi:hypothetical protein
MFVDLSPRMLGTSIDKFRTLVSKEKWDQLIPVLLRLDPSVAASIFMDIPVAQQDELFRRLPIEFAAKLAEILPYYGSDSGLGFLRIFGANVIEASIRPMATHGL